MTRAKNQFGTCRICGQKKKLSYEHVPPRVALNKKTRYISVPFEEWTKNENILKYTPKGKILQGGIGFHSLCEECNSFLGTNYVKSYENWVLSGVEVLSKYNYDFFRYIALQQSPLKVLKQIISMFLAMNDEWYLKEYPELSAFVKDPFSKNLPSKFNVFLYLNNEGQYRYSKHFVISQPGLGIFNATELAFPPFGYVLTFDFNQEIDRLLNITNFKNAALDSTIDLELGLYKLATYLPFPPLDYRTKNEIGKEIEAAILYNEQKTDLDLQK